MSRVGQVWESREQGVYLVLGEEKHSEDPGKTVLKLASLESGSVEFLPEYVLRLYEIPPPYADMSWWRIA